ncbi:hypothetical protein PoB_000820000 [Plakobranchus ocellatus]|uniref:DUF19 domain-containing protein n=1 Tax=Plakobranchus ocellatus TaxID=259542 RepID=A0AAV3YF52_9GAST|nr:hypothetical protein PoB_000820000 [Plakobranchus ocellatus]
MWKLLALLSCLILVRDVKGDCTELLACKDAIPQEMRNFDFINLLRINYEILYPFCTTGLSNFTSCFNNTFESCGQSETKTVMKTTNDVLEYMCGAEGRQGPRLFSCFHTLNDFSHYFNNGKTSEACSLLDEYLNCLVERVTDICGADTRPFAANSYDIMVTNAFSKYCP